MEGRRFALLIANSNYADPELSKLMAPADDAADLLRVLENPEICGFQVEILHDEPAYKLSREIEKFFDNQQHDDLCLLYFSGHGITDLDGQLYFAAADTEMNRHQVRRATAISARFVNEVMGNSRSRRQVLLLDCCHSGAFKEGMLAKGSEGTGVIQQLQGQGRVVLTASNALQYSFEGDIVRGGGNRSVFTRTLVEGLETGDADVDGDGRFSIDDLYSYVCDRIKNTQQLQQPMKISLVEGEIFLGNNPRPKAVPLPEDLLDDLSHPRLEIRRSAVDRLSIFLHASHKGRMLAAYRELTRLQEEDDSLQIKRIAKQCIEQYDAQAKAGLQKAALFVSEPISESVSHAVPDREEIEATPPLPLDQQPEARGRSQVGTQVVAPSGSGSLTQPAESLRPAQTPPISEVPQRSRQPSEVRLRRTLYVGIGVLVAVLLVAALVYLRTSPLSPLKPDYAGLHINLAKALEAEGHYDDAIAEYKKAIQLNPDFPDPHNFLGNALKAEGQYDAAIAEYKEAIRLKPDYPDPHINLGAALDDKGQYDAAIAEYKEAIRLKPDYAEAHNNLGVALDDKGQYDAAIAEYKEAIRLKPDFAEAHNNLGVALAAKGQYDAAIAEYKQAIRLNPNIAEAHFDLGNSLNAKGQHDAAIAEYKEAIRLNPDYARAHYDLAKALDAKGQHDAAIAEYKEAIRLNPVNPALRLNPDIAGH